MPKCECKGCENAATWHRAFGGRMVNVCGTHRMQFANDAMPDPELEDGGEADAVDAKRKSGKRPAAPAGDMPAVRAGADSAGAEDEV